MGVEEKERGQRENGGILDLAERPPYPPYWKNGLLFLPLNRSVVLGPYAMRGINLPCKFPVESLQECFVMLPNRQVTFIVKTDGVRIWRLLRIFQQSHSSECHAMIY